MQYGYDVLILCANIIFAMIYTYEYGIPRVDERTLNFCSFSLNSNENVIKTGLGLLGEATDSFVLSKTLQKEDNKLDEQTKLWLERYDNVIYVSFGTQLILQPEILNKLANKLNTSSYKILWSLTSQQQSSLYKEYRNIYFVEFTAQQLVLQHKSVVCCVHHGGINNSTECIMNEVPSVVIPHLYDQFYNAFVLENSYCAKTLSNETVSDINMQIDRAILLKEHVVRKKIHMINNIADFDALIRSHQFSSKQPTNTITCYTIIQTLITIWVVLARIKANFVYYTDTYFLSM